MLRLLGIIVACLVLSPQLAAAPTLRVGILPSFSPKLLLTQYQPLRSYLERELQRPVEMTTAPDFRRFHGDTLAGDFDFLLSAPHLARHAQLEAGFLPVATYLSINRAILVMAKQQPVTKLDELRGRSLAIYDPLALVTLQAQQWLEGQGLKAGRDYRFVTTPSQTGAAHSVQIGESLMGVIAPSGLRQLPPEAREQIQVYAELAPLPTLIWLVHPRMAAEAERIKTVLLRFGESAEGAQFFGGNAFLGMRPVGGGELQALDRPAREVGRLLQAQP